MRKMLLSLAALAAIGLAPYVAPAQADETVVIKRHHHEHYWNYEPRHDKTVIIKKHRHEHDEY